MLKHHKTFFQSKIKQEGQTIIIEGPLPAKTLEQYNFDQSLTAFRRPDDQFKALKEIADLDEGRIIICRVEDTIIGYVTFLHPDPLERWSDGNHPFIMELGAIEVSLAYRGLSLASLMLELSIKDDFVENYIIITTEYYWHWDLKNSGLDVYEYKKLMQKLMGYGGLEIFATDDPEITSHPANCLMARIGSRISINQLQAFDDIRFMNRFFF